MTVALFLAASAHAVVTPAPDRAFCTNAAGDNINFKMAQEPGNPLVHGTVVQFVNSAPVDGDGDGTNDFLNWSGTLLSAEWVLTCAHALQGTNGLGAGVVSGNLECVTDDGQYLPVAALYRNPGWQKEQYLLGNDIALVRLAQPVAGVAQFARLSITPFVNPVGVVIAGFGEQGDGDTGGNGSPGFLSTGVNTLDVAGGDQTTDGFDQLYTPFPNTPDSVAMMDFDKWQSVQFTCQDPVNGAVISRVPVALSGFSKTGLENEVDSPPLACAGPIQPAAGHFAATVCDFLPAGGDSGGPAFLWPSYPAIPAAGYYLTGIPVVFGVTSFRNTGAGANNTGVDLPDRPRDRRPGFRSRRTDR